MTEPVNSPVHGREKPSVYLLKSSAIYGLGALLTKGLGFILIPLYTRFLTVEEYGALALLNLMLQVLTFVFLLGISTACMRFYFDTNADAAYRKKLYGNGFLLLLTLPLVFSLLLGPLAYYLVERYLPSIPFLPYVLVVFLIAIIRPVINLVAGLLRVQERATTYIVFFVSFFGVQSITIIVAIAGLDYGLQGQLMAQLFTTGVYWIVALVILRPQTHLSFSPEICTSLLRFGVPLVPYFIFTWINAASGRFVLEEFSGLAEVGVFVLALQFGGLIGVAGTSINNALMPYFLKTASQNEAPQDLGRLVTRYIVFFGLLGVMVCAVADPAIYFMATKPYYRATAYVPFLALGAWIQVTTHPFTWSLMHCKKTGWISFIEISGGLLNIILLLIFVAEMGLGIWGVIYATMSSNIVMVSVKFLIGQRYFRINLDAKTTLKNSFFLVVIFVIFSTLSSGEISGYTVAVKLGLGLLAAIVVARSTGLRLTLRRPFITFR